MDVQSFFNSLGSENQSDSQNIQQPVPQQDSNVTAQQDVNIADASVDGNIKIVTEEEMRGDNAVATVPPQDTAKQQPAQGQQVAQQQQQEASPQELLKKVHELEELTKASPYKSQIGELFDDLVAPVEKGGKGLSPETAIKYIYTDVNKMFSEGKYQELIELELQISRPDLSPEDIRELVEAKYKVGKYAGVTEDDDPETIAQKEKMGRLQMKYDAGEKLQQISKMREQLLQPKITRSEIIARQEESKRVDTWMNLRSKIAPKEFVIPIGQRKAVVNGKEQNVTDSFRYQLTPEQVNRVWEDVAGFIKSNKIAADENGISFVKNELIPLIILKHNFTDIANKIFTYGKSKQTERIVADLSNPVLNTGSSIQDNGQIDGNQILSFFEKVLT